MTKVKLIHDGETLVSAKYKGSGTSIPIYDDGFGPLFICQCSIGLYGIVRAQTWEDAYGICEDEFFSEASETVEELVKEYGFRREDVKIVLDPVEGERPDKPTDYTPTLNIPFIEWRTIETPDPDAWTDNELFQESFGFRPNGPNANDKLNHGIYARDLNGESIIQLTQEILDELGIELEIEGEGEGEGNE